MTKRPRSLATAWLLAVSLFVLPSGSARGAAGSWRPIGPEGGAIEALAASPGEAGVVYAITSRGTLLASSDGAASWSSRGRGPVGFAGELAVGPESSQTLFASTYAGLFRSRDGGASWAGLLSGYGIWTFGVAASDPKVLYVSQQKDITRQQLLKSVDGGATWTDISFGEKAVLTLAVDGQDARVAYAAGPDGVFRSGDGGATWVNAGSGLEDPDGGHVIVSKLVVDPRHPATLYAGAFGGRIFKSTDRGAAWSLAWAGPERFALLENLMVDPASGAVYTVLSTSQGDTVFRSTDGGVTWGKVFSRFEIEASAAGAGGPGRLYVGTKAGGVYRSADGGSSWQTANHGLRDLGFTAVAADPHAPGLLLAVADPDPEGPLGFSRRFVVRSADSGATWSSPFGSPEASPFASELAADPAHPGTWYLAGSGGVWKSRDGGKAWEQAGLGLRLYDFVSNIALAPSSPDGLFAVGWGTLNLCGGPDCVRMVVYRSVDGAAQWRRSRVPGLEPFTTLDALAVDPSNPSTVYVAGPGFFKSVDGGVNWTRTGSGLPGYVIDLAADPFSKDTLYAAVAQPRGRQGKRIFKSLDGGRTWGRAAGGLPSGVEAYALTPDPGTPGTLYAATSRGVYVTRDRGGLWTAMNDGFGDLPVWTVAVDPLRPGVLYAGRSDGLFEFSNP